jgi:hypothetical protein
MRFAFQKNPKRNITDKASYNAAGLDYPRSLILSITRMISSEFYTFISIRANFFLRTHNTACISHACDSNDITIYQYHGRCGARAERIELRFVVGLRVVCSTFRVAG